MKSNQEPDNSELEGFEIDDKSTNQTTSPAKEKKEVISAPHKEYWDNLPGEAKLACIDNHAVYKQVMTFNIPVEEFTYIVASTIDEYDQNIVDVALDQFLKTSQRQTFNSESFQVKLKAIINYNLKP